MATQQEIIAAIRNADAAGDSGAVRKLGAYLKTMDAAPSPATMPEPEKSFGQKVAQQAGNAIAGAVRGAGSIGATILAPIDIASDALAGKGLSLESNRQRRKDMDDALGTLGAETDSFAYQGGKLAGELAGTAGAGGALANTAGRVAPQLAARSPGLINAIRSGGFTAGTGGSTAANLATRAAGGAITGGASAGLVNPEDAGTGALIGGALPVVTKAAGAAGNAIGRVFRGPEQAPELAKAVQAARTAGYVVPPTQARPTLLNRLAEGFSGKLTTAQNASAKNQGVTNSLAAKELGLPADTKLTPEVLEGIRSEAGSVYHQLKTLGDMTGDAKFNNQVAGLKGAFEGAAKDFPGLAKPELSNILDSLKQPTFKASSAVDAIRLLRESADKAFASGDKGTAKALRQASGAMEDLIERNLLRMNARKSLDRILQSGGGIDEIGEAAVTNGASDMLKQFRDARKLIAKTYSVEKALNPTSGSVDARKLAGQLNKGKPLSGELRTIADFANQFPKAAQAIEGMGSLPQTSPLDWAVGGGISAATSNPLMLAGVMARPATRKLTLSDLVQNRLVQPPPGAPSQRLSDLIQGGYRAAPIALSDR